MQIMLVTERQTSVGFPAGTAQEVNGISYIPGYFLANSRDSPQFISETSLTVARQPSILL